MDDEVFALFVTVAAMTTLAMPDVAQPMFAVFAAGLALATGLAPAGREPERPRTGHPHATGL